MTRLSTLAILIGATTAPLAAAQTSIDAWTTQVGGQGVLDVALSGDSGAPFAVFAGPVGVPFSTSLRTVLATGRLDPLGDAHVVVPFGTDLPANFGVDLHVATRAAGGLDVSTRFLPLSGSGGTLCQEFDPNFTLGTVEPVAGQVLTNEWSLVGMSISGTNNTAGHPDAVCVFDSANPTGDDADLATPGSGPGNSVALGQVLILPEDAVDLDSDGIIDAPDDEQFGGTIRFDFDEPYRMCSATLLDIDDSAPSELRFFLGDSMTLETIPVPFQGDNGVQTLTFDKRDVRALEVVLGGSGAIARLGMVPCPMVVNLDETPFGRPLGLQAGSNITNQFASLGLTISAENNVLGHPDKAILFDSENPTGDDFDLMTPGSGVNNDEPLGLVLILAENDVDADMDGLVDDPDDESGGGQIDFVFAETVTFFSTRVLDVDAMERDVFTFFDESDLQIDLIEIGALGDNSVQTLTATTPITGVKRVQVNLTGSGAFARLRWCPDSNTETPAP